MRARAILVLACLTLPAAAPGQSLRPVLCHRSTLFVLTPAGEAWPDLALPERYVVELREQGDLFARTDAVQTSGEPFLAASFPSPLPAGTDFRLAVFGAGGAKLGEADLSTRPKAAIQLSEAAAEAHYRLEVDSRTPLIKVVPESGEGLRLFEVRRKELLGEDGKPVPEETIEHPVDLFFQPPTGCGREASASYVSVDLRPGDRLRDGSVGLRLVGLTDVFGQSVVATGDLVPAKVPKGKDDAALYVKALFESAAGSADAYSLDLKLRPQIRLQGRWLFRPEVNAYLAKNVPAATESIRLSALFSHTGVRRGESLVAQTFSLGPTVHADRDFEQVNALLDLRWQPDFRGQYQPRENRRFAFAAANEKRPDEVAQPLFGFGFDAYVAVEAGRTVRAETSGDRDVLRLRPHFHGFVELGRFTLDLSSSLRYLFLEEPTAEGFQPYTEATLSFAFDPAKHLALAVTYKDGSQPPLFGEADRYSVGIVAKY